MKKSNGILLDIAESNPDLNPDLKNPICKTIESMLELKGINIFDASDNKVLRFAIYKDGMAGFEDCDAPIYAWIRTWEDVSAKDINSIVTEIFEEVMKIVNNGEREINRIYEMNTWKRDFANSVLCKLVDNGLGFGISDKFEIASNPRYFYINVYKSLDDLHEKPDDPEYTYVVSWEDVGKLVAKFEVLFDYATEPQIIDAVAGRIASECFTAIVEHFCRVEEGEEDD